jgi:hypothetical protein
MKKRDKHGWLTKPPHDCSYECERDGGLQVSLVR